MWSHFLIEEENGIDHFQEDGSFEKKPRFFPTVNKIENFVAVPPKKLKPAPLFCGNFPVSTGDLCNFDPSLASLETQGKQRYTFYRQGSKVQSVVN